MFFSPKSNLKQMELAVGRLVNGVPPIIDDFRTETLWPVLVDWSLNLSQSNITLKFNQIFKYVRFFVSI